MALLTPRGRRVALPGDRARGLLLRRSGRAGRLLPAPAGLALLLLRLLPRLLCRGGGAEQAEVARLEH